MRKNINIEILRIISMVMVIILHFLLHGNILNSINKDININNFLIFLLETISIIAVNIYVLIGGYYLCEKKFDFKRVINILIKVYIYSAIIGIILILTSKINLNIKNLYNIFFPFLSQEYWYVNAYIILLLISPFINMIIEKINKKQFQVLLIILLICNSVLPVFTKSAITISSGNSVTWFINLYLISAYIKKYSLPIKNNLFIYSIILILFNILILATNRIFNINIVMHLYSYNTIFVLSMSVLIFNLFLQSHKKYNENISRKIQWISSSTFSVYLISDNKFIRKILWNNIINISYYDSYLILKVIFISIIIFIICIIIDKIIQYIYKFIQNCTIIKKIIKRINYIYS